MLSPDSKRIHVRLTGSKTIAVYVLLSIWSIFSVGLRAQQADDLPDMPIAQPGSDAQRKADQANSNSVDPLTFRERVRIYRHSFTHPEGLVGPLLGAAVGQARNTPPEWGQGAEGFGRRAASGYGRSIISRTIALGVGAVDHEDSRYTRSSEKGIWRRGWYATTRTFVSRAPGGGNMPAFSRFAGAYGAAFIANSWEPPSQANAAHAVERGSTALLSSVGWHILEEFWPDIRKNVLRRSE